MLSIGISAHDVRALCIRIEARVVLLYWLLKITDSLACVIQCQRHRTLLLLSSGIFTHACRFFYCAYLNLAWKITLLLLTQKFLSHHVWSNTHTFAFSFEQERDGELLGFVAGIFATLPYMVEDEPLHVVSSIEGMAKRRNIGGAWWTTASKALPLMCCLTKA